MALSEQKNEGKIIRDLTVGSVPVVMLKFAMPLLASGLLQTLYNMVDMIVVGKFVGSNGLAAVSIGGEMLMLVTFVAMGMSNAGQILLARYVGENRRDLLGKMVATLFTFLLGTAIILTVIFHFAYVPVLRYLNTPADSWEMTCQYTVTCVYGLIFIYGYNLVSAIMRGMGDSRHPFIFIAIASILNIILDLVFVAGMKMGPLGAALGTVIGQAVSFLFALVVLFRNRVEINFDFKPKSFRIHKEVFEPLLRLGVPMVLQSAAVQISMLFVNSYINAYGTTAVAVTGVGRKIESLIMVVAMAISSTGGAMISQALGARKVDRVPKVVTTALGVVFIPSAILAVITWFHVDWLFGLFSDDPEVLGLANTYIPVAMVLYLGAWLRPAFLSLINGTGNSKLNLMVGLMDGIVCRIGLSFLLGVLLDLGIMGFWFGNAISGLVPFFIGIVYLLSGTWKNRVSK